MKKKNTHSDNIRLLFGVGGAFAWIIISTLLFALARKPASAQEKGKHHPYVQIDSKRSVQPGDTLYVIAVRRDSVFLYKK